MRTGQHIQQNSFERGMTRLLISSLEEAYFCEQELLQALKHMSSLTGTALLRELLDRHATETQHHLERLEEAFAYLGNSVRASKCRSMVGLLKDHRDSQMDGADPPIVDHRILTALCKAEMLEIAAYRSCIQLANQLNLHQVAHCCMMNLGEELDADRAVTTMLIGHATQPSEPTYGTGKTLRTHYG